MAEFQPGVRVETPEPSVEVTLTPARPLPPGRHTFSLVVVDDSGNKSMPDMKDVIVFDDQKPTAVLDAPHTVAFGQSFVLSGARSIDAGGRVVRYIWTLLA